MVQIIKSHRETTDNHRHTHREPNNCHTLLERRVTVAALSRKLDAVQASAAAQSAREMNAMRLKLDAAEASAAALTAALVECRVAAADEHLHRMRAEQTEAPTALLDCSFASRRRASGLMPG